MKMTATVHLLCLIALAALSDVTAGKLPGIRTMDRNEDNLITPGRNIGGGSRPEDIPRIVKVSPSVVHANIGERLELECEVIASPPPLVQWIKGSNPAQQADQLESNDLMSHIATGLVRTMSRLVIDCVMPQHEGLYTCVATAGVHTVLSSPTMLLIPDNRVNNLTALLTACPDINQQNVGRAPRIVQWNPYSMHFIGEDVILPCRAVGYPQPTMHWVAVEKRITVNDGKFEVLPDGDLYIKNLQFSDPWEYKCVAKNRYGNDSSNSGVYPTKFQAS